MINTDQKEFKRD